MERMPAIRREGLPTGRNGSAVQGPRGCSHSAPATCMACLIDEVLGSLPPQIAKQFADHADIDGQREHEDQGEEQQ